MASKEGITPVESFFKAPNPFTSTVGLGKGAQAVMAPLALTDPIPVSILPAAASASAKNGLFFGLMLRGTSDERSLAKWKSWISGFVVNMVPALASKMPAKVFTFVKISDQIVNDLAKAFDDVISAYAARDPSGLQAPITTLMSNTVFAGMPEMRADAPLAKANKEWVFKVIMMYFSVLLFVAGKRIEGDNHEALSINRPRAVKKKAHISSVVAFLDGDLRMSDTAHIQVNSAWAEMSALKGEAFREFAKYTQSDTDFGQDLIYTTMHLLEWNGMQHAKITMDFLHAYPWATEIPALRTPIAIYLQSLYASVKYPVEIRPYLKLIYGDKVSVFPRKDLEPLVACAVAMAKSVSPTLADFYVSGDYNAIVESFLTEARRRQVIREGHLRAEEIALSDALGGEYTPEEATPSYETATGE